MFESLLLSAVLAFLPFQSIDHRGGGGHSWPHAPGAYRNVEVDVGPRTPDVLVIIVDDINWDDLESVSAPHISDLANQGMTLRNGYSFPLCSLTRYSVTFGRYPRRDAIGQNILTAPPSPTNPSPTMGLQTLATMVRTMPSSRQSALIGKWHLGTNPMYDGNPAPDVGPADIGAMTPLLHGYDHFLAGTMANLGASGGYYEWNRVDDGVYSMSNQYVPAAQLAAFEGWWPFTAHRLGVFATHLAHAPLDGPPLDWLPPGYPAPTTPRERFETLIVACDTLIGRVLENVDLSRTYVFLLADNGTQHILSITPCGSDATFEGCTKQTVWQGGINVPFMVAGPGIPPGTTSHSLVSCVDLMATIGELLGVPALGEDTISFAPVLFDPEARTRRVAFSEVFGTFKDQNGADYYREEMAAIGERYKLRDLDGEEFLYDLQADPGETVRLDEDDPLLAAPVAELRAVLANPLDRSLQAH